ncbi:MAG: hypothetical protein HY000_01375 [Planctomycetes bacterium]|nr:hypothetical protein [Planctomycetota bacterium]
MPSDDHRNLKRPLLYALVASVIVGAVLGIIIVLRNTWGWFEIRVILTTITVAIVSLCGLACDLSRTPRGANLLPFGGLALTFLAAGLILIGMWADPDSEGYWKTTAAVSIFAVATVHVCLLSIAKLAGRFQWIFFIACQVIYGLAILLVAMIFWELGKRMFRILVTVSIVDAALTLVIPLLHRISRTGDSGERTTTALEERNLAAIDEELSLLRKRIAYLEKLRSEIEGDSHDV